MITNNKLVFLLIILFIWGCDYNQIKPEPIKDSSLNKVNKQVEVNKITTEYICKCLLSDGDSKFMIENKIRCRDSISIAIGVENWEKINMSENSSLDEKFNNLAKNCDPNKLHQSENYLKTEYKCKDMDSYNLGYRFAKDQNALVEDCDYLYNMAITQNKINNKTCFCLGVIDFQLKTNK